MPAPGLLSLLPAALAVGLALWTKNVFVSLFAAVWCGGIVASDGNPIWGLVRAVDPLLVDAVADKTHVKIVVFSLLVGATVAVMSHSGGTAALVRAVQRFARTRRSTQTMSWLSGMIVFFDDYANCLVVGATMRPITDRTRVSRAKLAYIVDSTAAPVATLALVSTWVGFEVGLIGDGLAKAGMTTDPYAFFLEGWAYRFYPILTVVFVGAIALSGRDFGPMLAAERELQRAEAPALEEEKRRGSIWLAIIPVVLLVGVSLWVMYRDGRRAAPEGSALFQILGASDGLSAMVKGSLAALFAASGLAVATRALGFADTTKAAVGGMRELFDALVILHLAWALGASMNELHAAEFLVGALSPTLPAFLLPTLVFVVAAVISFATGTSFGTMGILMPMVIPLAASVSSDPAIALAASGSVLAGATFGDHCSPISDTTVLSSLGSGCDLVSHVNTQLPYALAVGLLSILFGTLPAGLGLSPWIALGLGSAGCVGVVLVLGRRP